MLSTRPGLRSSTTWFLNSVADGHALILVEKARDDNGKVECGYTAWKALHD